MPDHRAPFAYTFVDFGCRAFSRFIGENPDPYGTEDFKEYVATHNRADRDTGELDDIASVEVLRLASEYVGLNGAKSAPVPVRTRLNTIPAFKGVSAPPGGLPEITDSRSLYAAYQAIGFDGGDPDSPEGRYIQDRANALGIAEHLNDGWRGGDEVPFPHEYLGETGWSTDAPDVAHFRQYCAEHNGEGKTLTTLSEMSDGELYRLWHSWPGVARNSLS